MKRENIRVTMGKLHILLPYHLQGKRAKTWCGRLASDVSWIFTADKKTLAKEGTCGTCKRALRSFHWRITG